MPFCKSGLATSTASPGTIELQKRLALIALLSLLTFGCQSPGQEPASFSPKRSISGRHAVELANAISGHWSAGQQLAPWFVLRGADSAQSRWDLKDRRGRLSLTIFPAFAHWPPELLEAEAPPLAIRLFGYASVRFEAPNSPPIERILAYEISAVAGIRARLQIGPQDDSFALDFSEDASKLLLSQADLALSLSRESNLPWAPAWADGKSFDWPFLNTPPRQRPFGLPAKDAGSSREE